MPSTRPPGPKTGLVTAGCYAAALRDCDGNPPTREHYVSEGLLERIPNALIEGLTWLKAGPKRLPTSAYASNILCARHNHALSPTDSAMCRFYDALLDFHDGKPVGWREIDGVDLERWALKTLFALIASGNIPFAEGMESDRPTPPENYLRMLFDDEGLPEFGGLSIIRKQMPDIDYTTEITLRPLIYPLDHERAGTIAGITAYVLGVGFYVTVDHRFLDEVLAHRPLGLAFGERRAQGCLALRWMQTSSNEAIVLRRSEAGIYPNAP